MGDGTTSVVIVAAELLKSADELVKQKIHPTSIIAGYRLASKEAVKYIKEHLTLKVDDLGEECLINCAKTCMSSKLIGADDEFFSKMVVDAAKAIKVSLWIYLIDYIFFSIFIVCQVGDVYPIKAINVLKAHGKSARESMLVDGYVILSSLPLSSLLFSPPSPSPLLPSSGTRLTAQSRPSRCPGR